MTVDTTTDRKVQIAISDYLEFRESFWYRAAHYESDSPLMIEADANLRKHAGKLIEALQEMLEGKDDDT